MYAFAHGQETERQTRTEDIRASQAAAGIQAGDAGNTCRHRQAGVRPAPGARPAPPDARRLVGGGCLSLLAEASSPTQGHHNPRSVARQVQRTYTANWNRPSVNAYGLRLAPSALHSVSSTVGYDRASLTTMDPVPAWVRLDRYVLLPSGPFRFRRLRSHGRHTSRAPLREPLCGWPTTTM